MRRFPFGGPTDRLPSKKSPHRYAEQFFQLRAKLRNGQKCNWGREFYDQIHIAVFPIGAVGSGANMFRLNRLFGTVVLCAVPFLLLIIVVSLCRSICASQISGEEDAQLLYCIAAVPALETAYVS